MNPGEGYPTPQHRARADVFVQQVDYALRECNQLIQFLQAPGPGQVHFEFAQVIQFQGNAAQLLPTARMVRGDDQRELPWDSFKALMLDLAFAVIESRGDGLYLPRIANEAIYALRVERDDGPISAGERERLVHLRAHVQYIRQVFNEALGHGTGVHVQGIPANRGEALNAWFYCPIHPVDEPNPSVARARQNLLSRYVREGTPVGRELLHDAVLGLLLMFPTIRNLRDTLRAWLLGEPFNLPARLHEQFLPLAEG